MTGKKKGAGLLRQPELLRQLLDGIFDALPDMKISVKTRIGWERAEEWPALLILILVLVLVLLVLLLLILVLLIFAGH